MIPHIKSRLAQLCKLVTGRLHSKAPTTRCKSRGCCSSTTDRQVSAPHQHFPSEWSEQQTERSKRGKSVSKTASDRHFQTTSMK